MVYLVRSGPHLSDGCGAVFQTNCSKLSACFHRMHRPLMLLRLCRWYVVKDCHRSLVMPSGSDLRVVEGL